MTLVRLPSNTDYRDYLASPQLTLLDPELKASTPETDPLGMPRAITGNFASVFRLRAPDGRAWAVKCFTRQLPERTRYQRIHQVLAGLEQGWRMDFSFQDPGLWVGERPLPILKMEWVQGEGLDKYVEGCHGDPERLSLLALRFAVVAGQLELAGIAHGDLQHGNILVSPDGRLRLVDYDGMFVPGLEGLKPTEQGHPNYQSPLRRADHFGPSLDRFSAWVIYGTLVALAARVDVWEHRRTEEEALLFTRQDYEVQRSPLLAHLAGLPDPRCRAVAAKLQAICRMPPEQVPPLDSHELPPPLSFCHGCGAVRRIEWETRNCTGCGLGLRAPAAAFSARSTGALPDWLRERMAAPAPRPGLLPAAPAVPSEPGTAPLAAPTLPNPPVTAPPPTAPPPSPPPVTTPFPRIRSVTAPLPATPPATVLRFPPSGLWYGRFATLLVLATWSMFLGDILTPAAAAGPPADGAALALFWATLVGAAGLWIGYDGAWDRRESNRRRACHRDREKVLERLKTTLGARLAEFRKEEAEAKRRIDMRHQELKGNWRQEVQGLAQEAAEVERDLRELDQQLEKGRAGATQRRDEASASLARLQAEESALLEKTRKDLTRACVETVLQKRTLREARLPGIGKVTKDRLATMGFHCAADLVGCDIRTTSFPRPSESAWLKHRDGRIVRVSGVGPEKARALVKWRQDLEARANQPAGAANLVALQAQVKFRKQHEQELAGAEAARDAAILELARLEHDHLVKRRFWEKKLEQVRFRQREANLRLDHGQQVLEGERARLEFETRRREREARDQAAPALLQAEAELVCAQADVQAYKTMEFLPYLKAVVAFWRT